MKVVLAFLLGLCTCTAEAQLVDSLWFVFEDAVGNRDSVLYGGVNEGDPIPQRYKNSDFNQFDDVFEVGIAKFFPHEPLDPDELEFCKYVIDTYVNGRKGSSYNQLYIRLKHPPLKMFYDKSFFDKFDSRGAYITPDNWVAILFPENFGELTRFECLYGKDSMIWELGTKWMHLDGQPIFKEANLTSRLIDTIWGLRHSNLYWHDQALGTPCPYPVSTNDVFSNYDIAVTIVNGIINIHNQGSQDIHSLSLFSLSGALVGRLSNKIEVGQTREIDLNISSPPGFYLIHAQLNSGTQISQKLIFTP